MTPFPKTIDVFVLGGRASPLQRSQRRALPCPSEGVSRDQPDLTSGVAFDAVEKNGAFNLYAPRCGTQPMACGQGVPPIKCAAETHSDFTDEDVMFQARSLGLARVRLVVP